MKLFLVHCGFYDLDLCDGIYESHVNFFVAGHDFEDAKVKVKVLPEFKKKRMHVDGVQEVIAVQGYRMSLQEDKSLNGETILVSSRHRDLATPKPL